MTETTGAAQAPPESSAAETPGGVITRRGAVPFEVHLDVFSGPFELLLGLISKHKLDVTEVAISRVTDEFIAHIRAGRENSAWDLDQASEFLLIAATLLDIKAASLLPGSGDLDDEDLALIEARDLLFARLLQYRAFKEVATFLEERARVHGRMTARQAGLEERFAALLPELVITITPEQLAKIAARALTPKPVPVVGLEHLHAAQVSVREQAAIVVDRLREAGTASFRDLVRDADSTLVIVARFLALLELFKEAAIAFDQEESLGELTVRWTGQEGAVTVSAEFDEDALDGEPGVADQTDSADPAPAQDNGSHE